MRKHIVITAALLAASTVIFTAPDVDAQQTFLLKNVSETFDFKIQIAKCEGDSCEGKTTFTILDKNESSILQTIFLPNLYFDIEGDRKSVGSLVELDYSYNSGVIFDDFNFDGVKDLALRKGRDNIEGEPFFEIFLASKSNQQFVRNSALTKLTDGEMGFFEIDDEKKLLETSHSRGCCWRQTIRYKIINDRPIKVYVSTENGDGKNDTAVVTTEVLVGGKWKRSVRRIKRIYDLGYRPR